MSLAIREMQIKTTRYLSTPVRVTGIRKSETGVGDACGVKEYIDRNIKCCSQ